MSVLLYKLENSSGSISITKNIIGKIVLNSIKEFDGKVMISNHKGKVPGAVRNKISDGDFTGTMDIAMGQNGLDLKFYVVIKFGTSIGSVTNSLIEEVHIRIKEITGIEPNSVAVVVTGMVSKQQMSRRNIEVKR